MGIANVTTDYTGRKKDINLFELPDATKVDAQTVLPKFGKNARFCAGVQKLIQKYAIILLTNVNSQTNYPDFGTDFMYTLKAGISPVDKLRAAQIFNLASYDAVKTLKNYQIDHPEIPLDERIALAKLSSITLYGGLVSFDVSITTEAGSKIDFLVPLPK
jgi:hypothetical protein